MPATFEPIASQTLSSNTTTVTFSSIPSTYTDLVLVVHGQVSTASDGAVVCRMQFNSDTGTNYSWTRIRGDGSAASSARFGSADALNYQPAGLIATSGATTIKPSTLVCQIMSYANTNVFTTSLAASGAGAFVERDVCLWRSTSAVSTITLTGSGWDFSSGSTFSLYGIKAA